MRRWLARIAVVLVVAVLTHLAAVFGAPRLIMFVAETRMSDQAHGVNRWLHAPRTTAQNQQVVRSSPDLAYSACVVDVSRGPVRLTAPGWTGIFSLSVYDNRSDNIFAADQRTAEGAQVSAIVGTKAQLAALPRDPGTTLVEAHSTKSVALLRYLAPTDELYAKADEIRRGAQCAPLTR